MWANLPNENRSERGELGTDQCVIDEKYFFIRGRIEIPVTDMDDEFAWLVWVEVTAAYFLDISEKWESEGRESTAPYSARLANSLPIYEEPTLGLSVQLHTRPIGARPLIAVTQEHLLHREQMSGISSHQVAEIAQRILSGR